MPEPLLTLTLPLPPTGTNHAYAPRAVKRKNGKMGASLMHAKEHVIWERETMTALTEHATGVVWAIDPAAFDPVAPLGLTFAWYFRDRRSDLDSRHKLVKDLVFDYLTSVTGKKCNDRVVSGDLNCRHYDKTFPHVIVALDPLAVWCRRFLVLAER